MKKLFLLASVAAIAGAPMANAAFDLKINGQSLEGVEGSSFTFNDGVLDLTVTGYTFTNPGDGDGDTGDGGGDTGDGGGDTGDGGGDTGDGGGDTGDGGGDTGDGDGDTGDGVSCADLPNTVICGTAFSDNALATGPDEESRITIPKGKTLATKFIAAGSASAEGRFKWVAPPGIKVYTAEAWISSTPGGEPVGNNCSVTRGVTSYDIAYAYNSPYARCILTQGNTYFVNVRYLSPQVSSKIDQKVKTEKL
jgi:hypothetical protein